MNSTFFVCAIQIWSIKAKNDEGNFSKLKIYLEVNLLRCTYFYSVVASSDFLETITQSAINFFPGLLFQRPLGCGTKSITPRVMRSSDAFVGRV